MPNRLIDETSPYLLQHAHNPVDWHPWGEEAFAQARAENKPILLSVGYSACHWCHVMERESFEDEAIAARMNQGFVCVKVDREERPDVDELYMRAVQALQGRGGWPMTVFLTPEGEPFFGGTYFPPTSRHGLPGFGDVLAQVEQLWAGEAERVRTITEEVLAMLRRSGGMPAPARVLTRDWLEPIVRAAEREFDMDHGGFGAAPKFPAYGTLAVLLAHHHRAGDQLALEMATTTLDGMARGGMYDLLGGGFARYSVDVSWRVPHFEKMLYDNAQLVNLYLDGWRSTGRDHYARVVRETIGWALREMRLDHGGFAASLDADSPLPDDVARNGEGEGEGAHEGAFYVWTPEQLTEVLGDDGPEVARQLGVTPEGTFERGASVLRLEQPLEDQSPAVADTLRKALPRLLEARAQRPRPERDDKVVTAWNGLLASALARAGAALGEASWVEAAATCVDLLLGPVRVDGRLMRTYKDGRAHIAAYADDYVNVITACLDLWDATFAPRWLATAQALSDEVVDRFWDDADGGLFYTGADQPALVDRSKHFLGSAEPGANGVAALAWVRLGRLVGRDDLVEKAERIVRGAQPLLGQHPRALGAEALAGAWIADGGQEIAIVGDPEAAATRALLEEVRAQYLPFAVQFVGPAAVPELPWLEGKEPLDGTPTAYVCEGYSCQLPVQSPADLRDQLEEARIRVSGPAAPEDSRQAAPDLPADPERWVGTGQAWPLEELKGQVVVLDFWTYCCINCHHMLPELAKLEAKYEDRPVAVVGVHSAKFDAEKQRDNVEVAMRRHSVRHPVVLDPDHELWRAYGVRSWPTTVVVDSEGRVAAQLSGESSARELAEIVDALLEEGQAAGTLAEGPIDDTATELAPTPRAALRFPGKVHVWPDAWEQEMGASLDQARVYISDTGHHRILEARLENLGARVPRLVVERVFGSGTPGLADGPADQAQFRGPQGVRRYEHVLYVADTENHALRQVDLHTGEVTTLAGTGEKGTSSPTREQLRTPREVALRSPWAVEIMPFRSHHLVFIAMAGSHQTWVYGAGHLGLHAGSGREDHVDGPAAAAALAQPSDLALYGRYLIFVDSEVSSIRAVDLPSHQVVTVVGRGLFDFGDVDGPADRARLQHPLGVTFAGETVFVADTYNHKVRTIGLSDGTTGTLAGGSPAQLREPGGIARAGRHLLVADTSNHRIRAVAVTGGELSDVPLVFP